MPFARKSVTQRKQNLSEDMQKNNKPQTNIRSRRIRSSIAASAPSNPSEALQAPSALSQDLIGHPRPKPQKQIYVAEDQHPRKRPRRNPQSASEPLIASRDRIGTSRARGRKRTFVSEDERSNKRLRQSVPEAPLRLSEENLRILESMTESDIPNKMDMGVTTSERARNRCPSWQASFSDMNQDVASVGSRRSLGTTSERARKRAPSRQASFSDTNQDTASVHSQKSSGTIGFYRYQILDRARIYVCNEPPPNAIQSQMDIIFKRKVPEERKHELVGIAKDISQKFINVLRGAHREDDLVELIYEALRSMYKDDTFGFPRKADWDPSLIPNIQQEFWDIHNIGINPTMRADDTVDRPSKRQQTNLSYLSPGTSQSTMPLPAPPLRSKQEIIVKCPRPDFTIGLRHATVANALIKRGLSNFKANDFIKYLQRERELCSDPTQNFLDVRFPILVIEGKAYATGKTVFEAQNQAAVSGSCMINLQQKLADLSKSIYPESERSKAPLAFSICMQGPHIEFWVHYSLSEDKVRMHYMNIFKTCYGSLQGGLEDFLMDLERLMSWTNDGFLENVAGQLFNLANHAAL